ncbi:MAG: GMC family oxidoreductase [Symploca sp. SIO2E9]|nr:GMC family oxidoreductase [Symploca sp. SIO2E9]
MSTQNYDVILVGVGEAGSTLANKLSQAGLKILGIEFGSHLKDHHNNFVENEAGVLNLSWKNFNYTVEGDGFLGIPNLGANVGGGTLVWTAMAFRYFERDFQLKSKYGYRPGLSLADWPLTYQDLESYYTTSEKHMGVACTISPWDDPNRPEYPNPAHCYYPSSKMLEKGMSKLGIRSSAGPAAINSQPYQEREVCLNCGYCRSGCRIDAKYQADKVMLPAALNSGNFELKTESVVVKILTSGNGKKAKGVVYIDKKNQQTHQATAKVVVVCNNPMETVRLFFNSADRNHLNGLGNQYDQLGRYFFAHPTIFGIGVTKQDTSVVAGYNMGNIVSLDFAETRDTDQYIGGFTFVSLNGSGAGVVAVDAFHKLYGQSLKDAMYKFPKSLAMIAFCEGMPTVDNRITVIPDKLDVFGVPVGKINYQLTDNDRLLTKKAVEKMRQVFIAAGAVETYIREDSFETHPMGGMRMGDDPKTSMTDSFGKAHSLDNLFVAGSSLFPSGSSLGPTLTIHALALRTSDYIIDNFSKF